FLFHIIMVFSFFFFFSSRRRHTRSKRDWSSDVCSSDLAFLVSLAFCVAASANLPVIIFTIFWKRFNTHGAITGIAVGLIVSLVLVILSPNVMNPEGTAFITMSPIFPLSNPAIISVPAGFIGAFLGTFLGKLEFHDKFQEGE